MYHTSANVSVVVIEGRPENSDTEVLCRASVNGVPAADKPVARIQFYGEQYGTPSGFANSIQLSLFIIDGYLSVHQVLQLLLPTC